MGVTSLITTILLSGGAFGGNPRPINPFYVDSILIVYGKHYNYIAFMSKNMSNNTDEKYIIHFMDLPVVYFITRAI